MSCAGDAGATCKGKAQLLRKGKAWGGKKFTIAAGQTKTVKIKLKKSAFKALKRKGKQKLTLKVTGTDSAAAAFTARKTVKCSRRRRKGDESDALTEAAGVAVESGKSYCPLS